eukprot:4278428-Amphidinium_carterae.1
MDLLRFQSLCNKGLVRRDGLSMAGRGVGTDVSGMGMNSGWSFPGAGGVGLTVATQKLQANSALAAQTST